MLVLLGACTDSQDMLLEDPISEQTSEEAEGVSVSEATALRVAGKFLNKRTSRNTSLTAESVFTINDSLNSPLMYVINYANGGFAVVSAKKSYHPIIAYSDENNFPKENIPGGVEEWMQDVKTDISYSTVSDEKIKSQIEYEWNMYNDKASDAMDNSAVRQTRASSDSMDEPNAFHARLTELWATHPGYNFYSLSSCSASVFATGGSGILANAKNLAQQYNSQEQFTIVAVKNNTQKNVVGPLLTTQWDQGFPFNVKCPNQSNAGCVAIAMAQIMKFHEHPNTYNWNNMPDNTATDDTQQLIYDIGVAVKMSYGSGSKESTSNIEDAKKAFTNNFQYNALIKDYSYNETANELLINRRPVYMRGDDMNIKKGHAWVCDGANHTDHETEYFIEYRQGGPGYYSYGSPGYPSEDDPGICGYGAFYFHMNWGWGEGSWNGWYMADNVDTGDRNFKSNRKNLYVNPK